MSQDTIRGDLALLWRTRPCSDVRYLFQAQSDAYDISNDELAEDRGWDYECDYTPIFKFTKPLSIVEVKNDAYLTDWNALRRAFRGRVFRFDPLIWERVNRLLIANNPQYEAVLKQVSGYVSSTIHAEEELEQTLAQNLGLLRKFGYDLELWRDKQTGESGRQYICKGHGGRIDRLCVDRKKHCFVVIELKNVRAGPMGHSNKSMDTWVG